MTFSRNKLETSGFCGWVGFSELSSSDCPAVAGVYVVTVPKGFPGGFLSDSPAGWFKGRNPSVSLAALEANWVDNAETVYIGQGSILRRRLLQYARFGAGRAIGHWGGRLVWQLTNSDALRVAWKPTPDRAPRTVESELIAAFRRSYGKPPFANEPHRLGR